jgi:hypothetical protein
LWVDCLDGAAVSYGGAGHHFGISFKAKVAALSTLVGPQLPQRKFNTGFERATGVWNDIVRMLFTAEELRNKLLHCYWRPQREERLIRRTKITAKAPRGIRILSEEHTSDYSPGRV